MFMKLNAKPHVILVGKTNVGKSTLFNRLANKRISIAHKTPGATRDCITKDADFLGHGVVVVDSGGIEREDTVDNPFQGLVSQRVFDFAMEKASVILFVVSAKDGITIADHEIAKLLRKTNKPVILVVNKVDDPSHEIQALDCLRFGFADPVFVSAAQVQGLTALRTRVLDDIGLKPLVYQAPEEDAEPALQLIVDDNLDDEDYDDADLDEEDDGEATKKTSICVVGKPNAGKSTLVNALLNEDRVMVSEIAGTTVDAVDTDLFYAGREICLVDTAGIRRQRSIDEEVEKMAVARTLCAIDRSHVSILLISATDGITEQDQKIAGIILEKKKPCIIAVNKWDEDMSRETRKDKFLDDLKFNLPFLTYAPVVFLSAKYGQNIFDAIDKALYLAKGYSARIGTSKLNRAIERAQAQHPPPIHMGRRLKLFFGTQVATSPPTFAISCSRPEGIQVSYKRYLVNFLRTDLELGEIPLRLTFRKKGEKDPFNREA